MGSCITTERLRDHVISSGPLAIFDLDRTLHAGSGLGVLSRHAFRSRLITRERMARSLVHDQIFRRRGSTDGHINTIAELALDMAGGTALDELEPLIDQTAEEIAGSVRPSMRAVLELHSGAGHHCVLLSASPHRLVARIADRLGFHTAIGTVIDEEDGILTGRIVPPMCYGPGKLERLRAVLGWPSHRPPTGTAPRARIGSYAYADSISDLPLLEAVEAPFVVSPDRRLRKIAVERNWPVLLA